MDKRKGPRKPELAVDHSSKICPACEVIKPLGEFYAHPSTWDRRYPECKPCTRQMRREHYQDKTGGRVRKYKRKQT